jgi:hypothetical protein
MAFDGYKWFYAGHDEAEIWQGPYDTREAAIKAGLSDLDEHDVIWVVEATNPKVTLADWIGADELIDRASEAIMDSDRVSCEHDEDVFAVTAEQGADLAARIRQACHDWQTAHGLIFTVHTFADMGNPEAVQRPDTAPGG